MAVGDMDLGNRLKGNVLLQLDILQGGVIQESHQR